MKCWLEGPHPFIKIDYIIVAASDDDARDALMLHQIIVFVDSYSSGGSW